MQIVSFVKNAHNSEYPASFLLDLKNVDKRRIDSLIADIKKTSEQDQEQFSDWLLSNVIMKKNQLKKQVVEWMPEESS